MKNSSSVKNFPTSVNRRQVGLLPDTRFRTEFLKLTSRSLRIIHMTVVRLPRVSVCERDGDFPYSCSFVAPCADNFAAAWTAGAFPYQCAFIGMLNNNLGRILTIPEGSALGCPVYDQATRFNSLWKNRRILDITHVDDHATHYNSIFVLSQNMVDNVCCIKNVPKISQSRAISVARLITGKAYSIVWNSNHQKISVGFNSGIMLTPCESLLQDEEFTSNLTPGGNSERFASPYVQRFDSKGNFLYFGFADGHLACSDMRSPQERFIYEVPIGDSVTGLHLLKDDVTMIVGCSNNKLCCADTRMKSVLFDYSGHRTNGIRTSFYLDESMQLLCSTGGDHTTRHWDLGLGNLLNELPINFQVREGSFMYSMVQSSSPRRMYSYTFGANKILYRENIPRY